MTESAPALHCACLRCTMLGSVQLISFCCRLILGPVYVSAPLSPGAAHIGAMYTAFLAVATACGTPAMLAAVALGQLSNLMGCLTTYGIGSAPPYFGAGYVPQVG